MQAEPQTKTYSREIDSVSSCYNDKCCGKRMAGCNHADIKVAEAVS